MAGLVRNMTSKQVAGWLPSLVVVNNPPIFTSIAPIAPGGSGYDYQPTATDADGDAVTITATTLPDWLTFTGGRVAGDDSGIAAGSYQVVLLASDGALSVEQSFVVVVSSQEFSYPEDRIFKFASTFMPSLVVGDTFRGRGTFWAGVPNAVYGVGSASSISAAIISADHTQRYCEPVLQSTSVVGSNWASGIIVVSLPKGITAQISAYIKNKEAAKVEIQVTIGGEDYTWFSPVQLIPGHIE